MRIYNVITDNPCSSIIWDVHDRFAPYSYFCKYIEIPKTDKVYRVMTYHNQFTLSYFLIGSIADLTMVSHLLTILDVKFNSPKNNHWGPFQVCKCHKPEGLYIEI